MNNLISNKINRAVATLILRRDFVGAAAQFAIHTFAFATGRQRGKRMWAGLRRAVCPQL